MRKRRALLLFLAGLLFAGAGPGCGTSRKLESVSVSPATADAQSFPGGQVQFVATGTYNQSPTTVQLTSGNVTWCVGSSNGVCAGLVVPVAMVDGNGLAQCVAGFRGTATILAGQPGKMTGNPDTGMPLSVYGAAQLTCP